MSTQTSAVGALTLPIPAGISQAKLDDPIITALLDFLGWSLKNDLDAKLTNLPGTVKGAADACPTANRFSFDPFEPRGHHVKRYLPSLYIWWDGNSLEWLPSQLSKGIQRDLQVLYLFEELPATAEMNRRSGLFAAVNAVFAKAAERGGHPTYSYNSKPVGTALEHSVGNFGSWEWSYLGGRGVQRIGIDDTNKGMVGARKAGRHFPGFAALLRVREIVQPKVMVDPGDVTADSPITIYNDGVEIMDRTLEAPDGDEAQP